MGVMFSAPFIDHERISGIRQALVKAYKQDSITAIASAAQEAQKYVDEGGDFDDWQFDDSIEDYEGTNPEMLAEKYLLRLLHNSTMEDDENQDYIRTGLCNAVTPAMRQFLEFKRKHPTAIFLFRCGNYYEAYDEDAKECAKVLSIGTKNGEMGITVSFPHHALDIYLPKLVRAGKRIAICDQLGDPQLTKKLVKRNITELVIPQKQEEQPQQRKKAIQLKLNF